MRRAVGTGLATLTLAGVLAAQGTFASGGGRGLAWQPRVHHAKEYANNRAGIVSFAIIGLDGKMHGFHKSRTMVCASVIKVMFLVAYLRKIGDRDVHHSDNALLEPMITRSDNNAATRVRDIVGPHAIIRLAHDAGMGDFSYNSIWGLSKITAQDQADFMYRLERYIPDRHEAYAHKLLSHIISEQRWGIARVQPRRWHLFFKGGWGTGTGRVDHQVAYVQRHRHRVALAILTEFDPSHDYGKQTLQGVAGRLLKHLPRIRGR